MGLRGLAAVETTHKRKLTLRKSYFFAIEKYVRDVKQGRKTCARPAGIDSKVHRSCKRRVTGDLDDHGSI